MAKKEEVTHESLISNITAADALLKAAKEEVTHESLISNITAADALLKAAKEEYKLFCKANPLSLPVQPTLHELRLMKEKNSKSSDADHTKSNKAAAALAKKEQLKQELKGA